MKPAVGAQLREREKELACLYTLAPLLTALHPLETTLEAVVAAVQKALTRPDRASVFVRVTDENGTDSSGGTDWHTPIPAERQHTVLVVDAAGTPGVLRAGYPADHNTEILDHERTLLDTVAHLLGNNLARRRAERELRRALDAENRKTIALSEVLELIEESGRTDLQSRLSPREQEIARLIADSKNTKEISAELRLSGATVERHRHNIRRKLGIAGEAVNLATFLRNNDRYHPNQ